MFFRILSRISSLCHTCPQTPDRRESSLQERERAQYGSNRCLGRCLARRAYLPTVAAIAPAHPKRSPDELWIVIASCPAPRTALPCTEAMARAPLPDMSPGELWERKMKNSQEITDQKFLFVVRLNGGRCIRRDMETMKAYRQSAMIR